MLQLHLMMNKKYVFLSWVSFHSKYNDCMNLHYLSNSLLPLNWLRFSLTDILLYEISQLDEIVWIHPNQHNDSFDPNFFHFVCSVALEFSQIMRSFRLRIIWMRINPRFYESVNLERLIFRLRLLLPIAEHSNIAIRIQIHRCLFWNKQSETAICESVAYGAI